jgi:hypothetical protein
LVPPSLQIGVSPVELAYRVNPRVSGFKKVAKALKSGQLRHAYNVFFTLCLNLCRFLLIQTLIKPNLGDQWKTYATKLLPDTRRQVLGFRTPFFGKNLPVIPAKL